MAGIFGTLGGFLLIVAVVAIAALLLGAITGYSKIDKDVLWQIFWAALITGAVLLIASIYILPQITIR